MPSAIIFTYVATQRCIQFIK